MKVSKDHPVYQAIRERYDIKALPRLIAEWNMNRYAGIEEVDNNPKEYDEAFEPEYFPIESVVEVLRPHRRGIVKARVSESRASHEFVDTRVQQFRTKKVGGVWTNIPRTNKDGENIYKTYTRPENAPRYYVSTPEDDYKYWTSPKQSNSTGSGGAYSWPVGGGINLIVRYDNTLRTNKISICAETTWCAPKSWSLDIGRKDSGGVLQWSNNVVNDSTANFSVDGNGAGNDSGRLNFYYNGTSWGSDSQARKDSARDLMVAVDEIDALRLNVNSVTKPDSHFSLIELSPRLEKDLTKYMTSVDDDFEMSEPTFLTPIGKASANNGSVQFFNPLVEDSQELLADEKNSVTSGRGLLFNNENPHSLFHGVLDKNIKFTLDYIYYIDGNQYVIPEFEMFTGNWTGQTQDNVSVDVADYSQYMMEKKPQKAMYLDLTLAEIIWRLCDSIGFCKYEVERMDTEFPRRVPIFWVDGSKTIWEVFAELTEGTQIAIYFDGTGTLKIKTKESAFDADKDGDSVWLAMGQPNSNSDPDFDDENYSGAVPDIVDLDKSNEYSANYVTVNYQETMFSEFNNGFPVMETVWEPGQTIDDSSKDDKRENGTFDDVSDPTDTSSTLVLRATPLKKDLLMVDDFVTIEPDQAKFWPYDGIVQIQGELIRYQGKQYIWYDNGNVRNTTLIQNADHLKSIEDQSGAGVKHKNHFTGKLKVVTRGLWNTENKRHAVEAEGYSVHSFINGNKKLNDKGWRHWKNASVVELHTPKNFKGNEWRFALRGASTDAGFYNVGTMIKFPKDCGKHAFAGITIHQNGTNDNGYFIELRPSKKMTASARKTHNELSFYSKNNTTTKRLGGNKNRGVATAIALDTWYEIDVEIVKDGGDHTIRIFVNGQEAMKVTVANGSEWNQPWTGKFGMFVRGNSRAQWEYLYAISKPEPVMIDNFSFMEKVHSSYIGNQWHREWVWRTRTDSRRTKKGWRKEKERFAQMFYDEFGPYAHEVREFDVNFEPAPVLHSRLYVSNDWQAVCPEYYSSAFGAHFVLANTSRTNAILHGADPALQGGNQSTIVFGRAVIVKEAETVIVKHEDQIRRRGKVEASITSPWIQSKSHALSIADWIKEHWGQPSDELTIEIFGNPLIEITDVITVSYKLHDFNLSSHQYFVTSASNSFNDGGITTTLVVRRARKLT